MCTVSWQFAHFSEACGFISFFMFFHCCWQLLEFLFTAGEVIFSWLRNTFGTMTSLGCEICSIRVIKRYGITVVSAKMLPRQHCNVPHPVKWTQNNRSNFSERSIWVYNSFKRVSLCRHVNRLKFSDVSFHCSFVTVTVSCIALFNKCRRKVFFWNIRLFLKKKYKCKNL